MFAKPAKQPPDLFSFLSPLSVEVWVFMIAAYLGVSVLLFVLARSVNNFFSFSPSTSEWKVEKSTEK